MSMLQNTAESILSEKTFREAERERGGNDVFASSRECSWADFNALPLPNRRMEEWRFASLSGVRFEDFSLPGGAGGPPVRRRGGTGHGLSGPAQNPRGVFDELTKTPCFFSAYCPKRGICQNFCCIAPADVV